MALLIVAGIVGLAVGGLYGASRYGRHRDLARLEARMTSLGMTPVVDPAAAIGAELLVLSSSFEAELDSQRLLGITPGRRRFRRTAQVLAAWTRTSDREPGVMAMARVRYRVTTRGGLTRDSSAITDDIVVGRLRRDVGGAVVVTPTRDGFPLGRTDQASNWVGRDGVVAYPSFDDLLGRVWSVVENQGAHDLMATDSRLRATLWSIRVWEGDPKGGDALESMVPRGPIISDLHGVEIRGDVIAAGAAAHPYKAAASDELISLVEHAIEHI